jgi:serine/threonine protein kinase
MTPAGEPYFVMELVSGLPLSKFCDEDRLTPTQRLELFVQICQGVQHAHQKGMYQWFVANRPPDDPDTFQSLNSLAHC